MPTPPAHPDRHTLHRLFIGPFPERVLSDAQHLVQKSAKKPRGFFSFGQSRQNPSDNDEPVEGLINQYAYAFHLKLGGSRENWNEERENNVKDEMFRRWRGSPWGHLWRGRKDGSNASQGRWVLPNDAGSFQVGDFLGLDTYSELATRSPQITAIDTGGSSTRAGPSTFSSAPLDGPSAFSRDTFVTARSHISPEPEPAPMPSQSSFFLEVPPSSGEDMHTINSTTSLLRLPAADRPPGARTRSGPTNEASNLKPALRARARTPTKSDSAVNSSTDTPHPLDRGKGKGKKVVRLARDPSPPAPPGEVLQRSGSEMQETSAAAAEGFQAASAPSTALLEAPDEYDDAKMKDRMAVRIAYFKDCSLGSRFDEKQDRSARDVHYEDWGEFMVVWRNGRLELYNNYRLPGREWVAGHKNLAFVVPLESARTKLSLYSFTDMSFCITCPPASLRLGVKILLPFQRRTGTDVFIFKARCRSRALDWIWRLWREMGGKLPPFIEIRSPIIDTRMKIDIPESADYAFLCHDNLVTLCMKTLSTVQDWDAIIKKGLADGAHMELAWRFDTNLDWVWWLDDINGNSRTWAVLAGMALKQAGRTAHLEVRLADHRPPPLHIRDGDNLSEPPSIEGYVTRVRSASGTREEIYLTVHNGLLFTLGTAHAHPPNPPGVTSVPLDPNQDARAALREEEVRRGVAQILAARSVTDLRAVVALRRASRPVFLPSLPESGPSRPDPGEEERDLVVEVSHEESDAQDVGGDAALTGDGATMRMRRCFELVMRTGHVIRFETWSAPIAIEWIKRLGDLIRYWKLRHIVDTRQEMDVVHFATGRPRITPQRLRHDEDDRLRPPEPPSNPTTALPYLSSIYHWCAYEGCRPISKTARIYVRQGLQRSYKLVQLFLVTGQLVQFHIEPKSTHYRRQGKVISLLDAYVVSGVLASRVLPQGQCNPNNPITPRRYADGLESNDTDENMLFAVFYVPHKVAQVGKVPALNAAKKVMIFRCRSSVERDVWCWALNTEIEKLARGRRDREEMWRNVGSPIPLDQGG